MMKLRSKKILYAATFLVAVASSAGAQVIRMEPKITAEPRQDIRLGHLARISGADRRTTEELANTIILSGIESSRTIRSESVLLALMSQKSGLNNLQMSGAARCEIMVGGQAPSTKGHSLPATVPAETPQNAPIITASVSSPAVAAPASTALVPPAAAAAASNGPTLARVIEQRVEKEAAESGDKLRVEIETLSPLLNEPVAAGRKWICRPLTRTVLGTVVFEAQLTEGPRIVEKTNIQTKVERFQQVVIANGKFDRGDIVATDSVHVEEAWLDRGLPTLFLSDKEVIGLEALRPLTAGSMLDQRDFRPAIMAAKGDALTVIYLAGSLKVQMLGRANEGGKLHDQIAVKNEQTGATYQAVLIGKRLAVVGGTLTESEEKKLRETR